MVTTFQNITLEEARRAVHVYNEGWYNGMRNPSLDKQARMIFADGLGSSFDAILQQVKFIGQDYGGAAGFKAAYVLAPEIARDIWACHAQYDRVARSAPSILEQISDQLTIETLYSPFVKPCFGKKKWQVWGAKFWHFLNPNAFPIEDSRVDTFFRVNQCNSIDKYRSFLQKFREFVISHQQWLPSLREIDGDLAVYDNKLWDKIFYGLVDL